MTDEDRNEIRKIVADIVVISTILLALFVLLVVAMMESDLLHKIGSVAE